MSKSALICDTSVLLYLGRVKHQHVLPELFETVYVPETVLLELDTGRLLRSDTINPRKLDWVIQVAVTQEEIRELPFNRLGPGEREVIAYAYTHDGCIAGLDDRQARSFAGNLSVNVIGIIGIFIKAKRAGLISSARDLLKSVQIQGFHLSAEVYNEALRLAGEKN